MAKKKKQTKYYAVKVGRKTGIFYSWNQCRKQVEGFSNAKYKSFNSRKEAESYLGIVRAAEVHVPSVSDTLPKAYYAVDRGRRIGIYTSLEDCNEQVYGYPGGHYKRYTTLYRAVNYLDRKTPGWEVIIVTDKEKTRQNASPEKKRSSKKKKGSSVKAAKKAAVSKKPDIKKVKTAPPEKKKSFLLDAPPMPLKHGVTWDSQTLSDLESHGVNTDDIIALCSAADEDTPGEASHN